MEPITTVAAASWAQQHWRAIAAAIVAAVLAVTAVLALLAGVAASMLSGQSAQQLAAQACPAQPGTQAAFGQWNGTQMTNAAAIVTVGRARRVPPFGEVVAVAAAMQESRLINLPGGDADSAGLFQERPSQGWGTHRQVTRPVYAARQFYIRLLKVPGWQQLPLTQAAQAVENSGRPGAYTKWQGQAVTVVSHLASPSLLAAGQCLGGSAQIPNRMVATAIAYARRQIGKPYLWGGTGPFAFDCSGLMMKAYQAAGLKNIPRTSEAQWTWGPKVAPGHQEPGDLVFFAGSDGTPTSPGHVGLVIGHDQMLEAYATGFPIRIASYGTPSSPPGDQTVVGFTRPWSRFSS